MLETLSSPQITVPILVAFIGALVAVTTAVIAKEHKVSEFRQAWISDLRNDIASSLQAAYTCLYEIQSPRTEETIEKYNASFTELEIKLIQIKLRLNPCDTDLIPIINSILDKFETLVNDSSNKVITAIQSDAKKFEQLSHRVLKDEWERVKRGEKRYIMFVTAGEFFGATFIIAFYVLLALVKFPEYFPLIS